MERFKRILKAVFFLPPLPTVLIALPSFILVFCCLGMEIDGAIAYISYGLSAYAMIITVTGFTRIVRAVRGGIGNIPLVKKLLAHPLGGRYMTDVAFRTKLSLYISFFINLLYIVMKMVSGIYYRSAWFVALSFYYILLAGYALSAASSREQKSSRNGYAFRMAQIPSLRYRSFADESGSCRYRAVYCASEPGI